MEHIRLDRPLADSMRPQNLSEFVGQEHLVGEGKILRTLIENKDIHSFIFWGPPGVGKTTLAAIIAHELESEFIALSAVMSGKDDLKKAIKHAEFLIEKEQKKTVLFIDEIHRWNKAQQDALLPYVEKGVVTLIGATTENPSFEIISALLSRSQVFVLHHLHEKNIEQLIVRAIKDKKKGFGNISLIVSQENISVLATLAGGDARQALNGLDLAVKAKKVREGDSAILLTKDDITEAFQRNHLIFDKNGEEFYNLISALHKSMRGSDPHASLYWLARMLEGGADPLYVARRLLRFASEDIGMANAEAMIQANAAYDACHNIGYPECTVHLAQAVVYCAKSKKSNVLYTAYKKAAKDAKQTSHLGVPLHLRNAPTSFMKDIGYGKDYKYNPDYDSPVEQDYFPKELKYKQYF